MLWCRSVSYLSTEFLILSTRTVHRDLLTQHTGTVIYKFTANTPHNYKHQETRRFKTVSETLKVRTIPTE